MNKKQISRRCIHSATVTDSLCRNMLGRFLVRLNKEEQKRIDIENVTRAAHSRSTYLNNNNNSSSSSIDLSIDAVISTLARDLVFPFAPFTVP